MYFLQKCSRRESCMIWIIASSSWILNLLNLEVIMNYRAGQPLNRIWVRETESIQSFSSENEIKPRSNEQKQKQRNRFNTIALFRKQNQMKRTSEKLPPSALPILLEVRCQFSRFEILNIVRGNNPNLRFKTRFKSCLI